MRRFDWQWLAINSLLLAGLAVAASRPQYGGTLRVAVHAALTSLDPADGTQPDSFARRNITLLIFETLVTTDDSGRVHPGLATSWQSQPGNQRWEFRLRRGVKFHDGTAFSPEIAAASLRNARPSWNVSSGTDSLIIELDAPNPQLPAELALSRNAIVKRSVAGALSGTGPFRIAEWQSGKRLSLAAEESCWRGRPFVDEVQIEMGRNFQDQMTALELGKVDLVDIAPEQSHRISADGRAVTNSAPMELVALLFSREAQGSEEQMLRQALALSVGRAAMRNVLLQGAGQATGAVLPNWMSGYGFVFPIEADLPRALHLRDQVRKIPAWGLGYDGGDSMARLLADRIALNAKDAGLTLQPTASAAADLRLIRIPLASSDPWVSLVNLAEVWGLPRPKVNGGSAEDLYAAERAMLATGRVIPLFHLPVNYGAAATLKNWSPRPDGGWDLADAWLGSEKP
jgi:MarR-like DNA-binding transcriptional regulator SgrR of sgrS sRNA